MLLGISLCSTTCVPVDRPAPHSVPQIAVIGDGEALHPHRSSSSESWVLVLDCLNSAPKHRP